MICAVTTDGPPPQSVVTPAKGTLFSLSVSKSFIPSQNLFIYIPSFLRKKQGWNNQRLYVITSFVFLISVSSTWSVARFNFYVPRSVSLSICMFVFFPQYLYHIWLLLPYKLLFSLFVYSFHRNHFLLNGSSKVYDKTQTLLTSNCWCFKSVFGDYFVVFWPLLINISPTLNPDLAATPTNTARDPTRGRLCHEPSTCLYTCARYLHDNVISKLMSNLALISTRTRYKITSSCMKLLFLLFLRICQVKCRETEPTFWQYAQALDLSGLQAYPLHWQFHVRAVSGLISRD